MHAGCAAVGLGEHRFESLHVEAGVLPFTSCHSAAGSASHLVGQPVADFRHQVPDTLGGTLGCTHLNDMLRMLADVPGLARHLPLPD